MGPCIAYCLYSRVGSVAVAVPAPAILCFAPLSIVTAYVVMIKRCLLVLSVEHTKTRRTAHKNTSEQEGAVAADPTSSLEDAPEKPSTPVPPPPTAPACTGLLLSEVPV